MLLKSILATCTLVYGISAIPDGKDILGYRTVSQEEAAAINANGKPVYDVANKATGSGGSQIGPGIYTSPVAGDFPKTKDSDWFCVFYASQYQLEHVVAKLWVPFKAGGKILFWDNSAIDNYITSLPYKYTPGHTLLMSWLQYKYPTNKYQLLIPPPLVHDAGMAITAVCKPTIEELPDHASINYDKWKYDIRGDKGPQMTFDQMKADPDYKPPS